MHDNLRKLASKLTVFLSCEICDMPPRRRRELVREAERNLLHEMYRRNSALWDVVVNDVRRDERFQNLAENVQALYGNVEV